MSAQYHLTYGDYNNWALPLNLAVGFHLVIVFSVLFLPGIFKPKPKFEDIYTVNLINIAEPVIEQSPPPAPAPEPEIQPEPEVSKKAVTIADPVQQPPPQPKVVKPVSLKPSKRKIKKKVKNPQKDRQKELERIKRQKLAEAVKAEQLAVEQARIAAEEAERQRRLMDQQLSRIKSQVRTTPTPNRSGGQTGSSSLSSLEKQYFLSVRGRIMQYWSLPEFKQFDESIQAIYVIKISRDGTVIKQFFEKYSNDSTFDQFVKKAIKDSSPLPPIPPAIKGNSLEFGLRFRPGDIK